MKFIGKLKKSYDKKMDERRRRQKMSFWSAIWQLALIGAACRVVLLIAFKIILSADRLGWLFIPFFFGYFILLWVGIFRVKDYFKMRDIRRQMGDEVYGEQFPQEWREIERREARLHKWKPLLLGPEDGKEESRVRSDGRVRAVPDTKRIIVKLKKVFWHLRYSKLGVILEASIYVWPAFFLVLVAIQILLHAPVPEWSFWPVLLGYMGILKAIFVVTQITKERRDLRGIIGDELYFKLHPKERARWECRLARRERIIRKKKEREQICAT